MWIGVYYIVLSGERKQGCPYWTIKQQDTTKLCIPNSVDRPIQVIQSPLDWSTNSAWCLTTSSITFPFCYDNSSSSCTATLGGHSPNYSSSIDHHSTSTSHASPSYIPIPLAIISEHTEASLTQPTVIPKVVAVSVTPPVIVSEMMAESISSTNIDPSLTVPPLLPSSLNQWKPPYYPVVLPMQTLGCWIF